jgi:site-specific DNA-cytosine methylase
MRGNHISLFAGVGMTDLAAEAFGFRTFATAEIDPWCRSVLKARFPDAVHFDDVHAVKASPELQAALRDSSPALGERPPLLISGGFPCQGVSSAGTGKGLEDARSGLWSEFKRVIGEFHPDYVLIENSPMLRTRGLDVILTDLAALGYNAKWDCIPAGAVGAPHLRDRIFVTAVQQSAPFDVDRSIVSMPDKLPRAGTLNYGTIAEAVPSAPIKEAKKACLAHAVACPATKTGAWPTPAASNPQDGESVESWEARRQTLLAKGINGNGAGMPLNIAVKMYPTPTKSDGSGGPGTTPKRTGGKNLRTVANDLEGNGRLNPGWVEWMMGLPQGWTNPSIPNTAIIPFIGWQREPAPRTVPNGLKDRTKRIKALGNGLVPQAAMVALGWVLSK